MKKIGIIIFSIILSLLLFAVGCETTPGNRPIASSSSKPTQSQSSSSKEVSSSSQEETSSAIISALGNSLKMQLFKFFKNSTPA